MENNSNIFKKITFSIIVFIICIFFIVNNEKVHLNNEDLVHYYNEINNFLLSTIPNCRFFNKNQDKIEII